MKTTHELEVDEYGELTIVSRTRLGHVSEADPEQIPAAVWDEYLAELAADAEAQRNGAAYEAAVNQAFDDRFGDFRRDMAR